jgi:hypothetical protein
MNLMSAAALNIREVKNNMNIFYLDRDPIEAARLQCDRHVVKMILETAQLLSTAHNELDGGQIAYKSTHKNHPSAVWARASAENYYWLQRHLGALGHEYFRRYGRVHKTIQTHSQAPSHALLEAYLTVTSLTHHSVCQMSANTMTQW